MSNVTSIRGSHARDLQIARGAFLHGVLKDERWSINQASIRMRMSKSVLASRLKGETPFLADEIAAIAELVKRQPVELYRDYLECTPRDLNPEPTDYGSVVTFKPRQASHGSVRPRGRAA